MKTLRNRMKKIYGERATDIALAKINILSHDIDPYDVMRALDKVIGTPKCLHYLAENDADLVNSKLKDILLNGEEVNKEELKKPADPVELLAQAGYTMTRVKTLAQAAKFKKYYRKNELICSFNSGSRFENNYVWFLVKDNAKDIKPANNPDKFDEYSLSVLSLQITKRGGLKLISRYNHSVSSPDVVYSNLNKLVDGLHESVYRHVGIEPSQLSDIELSDNAFIHNDALYAYIYEANGYRIGEDYYQTSNGEIIKINAGHQRLKHGIFFDANNGIAVDVVNSKSIAEGIKSISFTKDEVRVVSDKGDFIVKGDCVTCTYKTIPDKFLVHGLSIVTINLPNAITIGNDFMKENTNLTGGDMPNVESVGDNFLMNNRGVHKIGA